MKIPFLSRSIPLDHEKLAAPRYAFAATAEVVGTRSGVRIGRVKDLSLSGSYVAMPNPFPKHAKILITISTVVSVFRCEGSVAHSTPGIGMGVTFCNILPASQAVLQEWLDAEKKKSEEAAKTGLTREC